MLALNTDVEASPLIGSVIALNTVMFNYLNRCCFRVLFPQKWQSTPSLPVIQINMYTNESDDSNDDFCDMPAESTSLLTYSNKHQGSDEFEAQYLYEEIDETSLKMYCMDRIQLIQEDLKDPNLTMSERCVHKTNLSAMNNLLSNLRLSEKIKLGSLNNSQYTDAVILQKQVVCNLAGQKEYSDLIRPVVLDQPHVKPSITDFDKNINEYSPSSILKQPTSKNNKHVSEPCLAV